MEQEEKKKNNETTTITIRAGRLGSPVKLIGTYVNFCDTKVFKDNNSSVIILNPRSEI